MVSGEDHQLVMRLRAAGYPVVSTNGIQVQPSSRRVGRAVGGLADLLRDLPEDDPPELDAG